MDTRSKKISMENTPLVDLGPLPRRNRVFIELCDLYAHNKDDLFWVLQNMKLKLQNDEASHLAAALIRRVKNAKPKA